MNYNGIDSYYMVVIPEFKFNMRPALAKQGLVGGQQVSHLVRINSAGYFLSKTITQGIVSRNRGTIFQ